MVWYNPMTWFSSSEPVPSSPPPMAPSTSVSAPGPYGGRKTRRSKTRKSTKKSRAGRKSTRA